MKEISTDQKKSRTGSNKERVRGGVRSMATLIYVVVETESENPTTCTGGRMRRLLTLAKSKKKKRGGGLESGKLWKKKKSIYIHIHTHRWWYI